MKEEGKLDAEQQIRLAAVRLALQHKRENGTRYTIHSVASSFEDYIRKGEKFGDV